MFTNGGSLTLVDTTLAANTASGGTGGAGGSGFGGTGQTGGNGSGYGGALFNDAGTLTAKNVTIAGNTADTSAGGGIYTYSPGPRPRSIPWWWITPVGTSAARRSAG